MLADTIATLYQTFQRKPNPAHEKDVRRRRDTDEHEKEIRDEQCSNNRLVLQLNVCTYLSLHDELGDTIHAQKYANHLLCKVRPTVRKVGQRDKAEHKRRN